MVKVPEADLSVLSGQAHLTLYQWNMRIARHFFCSDCGIYMFHSKRAAPDQMGVNVRCLDGVSLNDAPVRATEGEGMTVSESAAKLHWPGPRVPT